MTTLSSDISLDHVIVYAANDLAGLVAFFERAGFQLTPLGRHDSGSVNRLAMLDGQYIELMGFEPGTPATVRPQIQSMPVGLNGIVVADRATDVRRMATEAFDPPVLLERPVDTPDAKGTAKFSITHPREGAADVRTFMCRHHTPELVWQSAWQAHPNGALRVDEVAVATQYARRVHEGLRKVLDIEGGDQDVAYDAAGTRVRVLANGERATLVVRTGSLPAALEVLRRSGVPHTQGGSRVIVPLPAPYAVDLVFEAAA